MQYRAEVKPTGNLLSNLHFLVTIFFDNFILLIQKIYNFFEPADHIRILFIPKSKLKKLQGA